MSACATRAAFSVAPLEAVRNASFDIASGETLGLVGESGSGKSTLGRVCLGLAAPSAGSVALDGEPFGRLRSRRGQLAVVMQFPEWALNPRLRCGRSVEEPLAVMGVAAAERRRRVAAMLESVGLEAALAERLPGELSGDSVSASRSRARSSPSRASSCSTRR